MFANYFSIDSFKVLQIFFPSDNGQDLLKIWLPDSEIPPWCAFTKDFVFTIPGPLGLFYFGDLCLFHTNFITQQLFQLLT